MTAERRAVLLLLALAVAGQGLRAWRNAPADAPGGLALLPGLPTAQPRQHRDSSLALARPLRSGERIDLDRAAAPELARLPRVGLGLARRIVADRERFGPFGSLEALDRVPGVGPGLLKVIGPHAAFSATPALASPPASAVALNSATAAELEALPHVGPALAERIVAYRTRHGPFASVDSLVRVPGVGPGILARIQSRLRL